MSLLASIIIPCLNEEKFIGKCLDSVLANDYPQGKFEILAIDGMSADKTREILKKYIKKYPFIRCLDNPKKVTPCALNIGIKNAKGNIIIRMDAHAAYKKDYISNCIKYLRKYQADNIGGIWKIKSRKNNLMGNSIALASSHIFSGGNAYYRIGCKKPMQVDTVPFGCYKKNIFKKIGFFNENLVRSQDMEFNLRLKKAGGKIVLHPKIISYYYTRSTLRDIFKHRFKDGIWAIYPLRFIKMPLSIRHYVPLGLALSLIILAIASFFNSVFLILFLLEVFLYFTVNIFCSCQIAIKRRIYKYLLILPIVFFVQHISYGLGSIYGTIKLFQK